MRAAARGAPACRAARRQLPCRFAVPRSAGLARALALAGEVIRAAGVTIDIVDVGGGFPVAYPDVEPPPLGAFLAEIEAGSSASACRDAAAVGRAGPRAGRRRRLRSSVQVQHCAAASALYINDGVYGSLADAGALGFRYPVRLIRPDGAAPARRRCVAFSLFGPTCDSADAMRGPFLLPADIAEGDWIEIGQLGAYGGCLRTGVQRLRSRPHGRGARRAAARCDTHRRACRRRLIAILGPKEFDR